MRAIFVNDDNEMKHKIIVDNSTQQSSSTELENKKENKILQKSSEFLLKQTLHADKRIKFMMNFTQTVIEQSELHIMNSIIERKEKIKRSNLNVFFVDDMQRHEFDHEINKD